MLAWALGMTVADLEHSMTATEYQGWQQFYAMYPFGPDRGDIGHAITSATVANCLSGRGRRFKVSDFMPKFDKAKPTAEQRAQRLRYAEQVFTQLANANRGKKVGSQ